MALEADSPKHAGDQEPRPQTGPAQSTTPDAEQAFIDYSSPEAAVQASESNKTSANDVPSAAAEHAETLSHIRSPTPDHTEKGADQHGTLGKAAAGGKAVIGQRETIPTTGKRIPTSKWEYVSFCIFCELCSYPIVLRPSPLIHFRLLTQRCSWVFLLSYGYQQLVYLTSVRSDRR